MTVTRAPAIKILAPVLVALLLATLVATAVFYLRGSATPSGVVLWQLGTWAPWAVLAVLFASAASRGTLNTSSASSLFFHFIQSLAAAFVHVLWFRWLGTHLGSTGAGALTLSGAGAWVLAFWFVLDLFVYWAILLSVSIRAEGFRRFGKWGRPVVSKLYTEGAAEWFTMRTGRDTRVLHPADIVWIEIRRGFTVVHVEGDEYWFRDPLARFLDILPADGFVRGHPSSLINLTHLVRVDPVGTKDSVAVLTGDVRRPLSRKGKQLLDEVLAASA